MSALRDGLGGGTGISSIEEQTDFDVLWSGTNRIYFRDNGISIYSSADGKLTIASDGTGVDDIILSGAVQVADNMDINGALDIDATTTSTNAVVNIAQAGTGKGLVVDQNNTANPGIAFEIDDEATGATNEAVKITSARTGTVMNVIAEGDASTILILEGDAAASTTAGLLIDINNTGGTDEAFEIDDQSTAAKTVAKIAAASTGTIVLIDKEATGAGIGMEIQNAGTGDALLIDQNNTGDAGNAIEIDDEATGGTNPAVTIASARTGTILNVAAEGDCAKAIAVSIADGGTQTGIEVDHNETNGNAVGIKVDVASTGASAFAFHITGAGTDSGIIQTNSVATDCAIDQVGAAIRITNGSTTYYIPCLTSFT